jgi:hypothetical protein
MQNKFLFHTNKGLSIAHIGSTASKKALLFIGRSNTQKNSLPLEALMEKLALNDYLLLWPESRKKLISRQLSDKSKNIISFIDKLLGSNETIVKKYYRKFIKAIILLLHPSKWDYLFLRHIDESKVDQTYLYRRAIQVYGKNRALGILSHSAGGVMAANLQNESNLKCIICFGYPFKHPEEPEDKRRTAVLEDIQTPVLIIQGCSDEYGGTDVREKYNLSTSVEIMNVDSNHDYEHLPDSDWDLVISNIGQFIELKK